MNKTVKKVFFLLATIVAIFLIWQLVFNDGGIIKTAYNAIAKGINGQYEKASGDATLIPLWDDSDAEQNANGQSFDIETGN